MGSITIDTRMCFECGAPAIEHHHVVPASEGGTMKLPLCQEHHYIVHGKDGTGRRMMAGHLTQKGLESKSASLRLEVAAAFMCFKMGGDYRLWGLTAAKWPKRLRRMQFLIDNDPGYLEQLISELQGAIGDDVDIVKYWTYRNDNRGLALKISEQYPESVMALD